MHLCFPIKIKKAIDRNVDIDADMITVNNFFAHFAKEISMTKYGDDKQLIPTFLLYEIHQNSDSVLKHLSKDSLKKLKKTMLYSKQSVYYNNETIDRRTHNSNTANDITNLNINDRITKFQDQLKNEYAYRIPLRYFTDLGKINFPLKIDFRIKCHLKTEMRKQFECKKKVTTIAAPDAQIIITRPPFIQYEKVLLDKNFRQYLETIMVSKKSEE